MTTSFSSAGRKILYEINGDWITPLESILELNTTFSLTIPWARYPPVYFTMTLSPGKKSSLNLVYTWSTKRSILGTVENETCRKIGSFTGSGKFDCIENSSLCSTFNASKNVKLEFPLVSQTNFLTL